MANKFTLGGMQDTPAGQVAGTTTTPSTQKRTDQRVAPAVLPEIPDKYTVKKGDTLSQIAEKYRTSLKSILQANKNIKDPNMISIGQSIVIPKKRGVPVYSDLKKSEWGRIKGGTNPYVAQGFSGKKGGTVRRKKGSTVKRNRGGKIVTDGNQYVANLYKGGKVGG